MTQSTDNAGTMTSALPIPPVQLREYIGGSPELAARDDAYLAIGKAFQRTIVESLPSGWTWAGKMVLDFGCGSSRVLRHFRDEASQCAFWGMDVQSPTFEWNQEHLDPPFSFTRNDEMPPLGFPDNSFDLVYALSVFTHLAASWAEWLVEVHRILRPNGLLVASFMGEGMSRLFTDAPWDERHVGMAVYRPGPDWDHGGPLVVHSPWWIAEHWGRLFDVVTIAPRGLGSAPETTPSHGWVVARKSERSATPEELRRIDLSNALEMSSSIHAFEGIRRQVVDLGAPSDPHDPIGATRPLDEIPSQAFMEAISPQPFSARLAAFGRADRTAAAEITSRVGRERLLEWAHSVALGSDAELRARVPPVPPLAFRRITAAPEEPTFLLTGLVDLAVFFDIYDRTASRQRRKLRVLDFACGCGRLARYLQVMGGVEAYGVDVNPDLVAWCQANLRNMLTGLNGMDPPMPVADAEMDFVYAMSVFTHLPEEPARGWLRDLARVLVPGGVLTLTTHGYTALRAIPNHPLTFHIDESEAISLGERLPVEGFITLPYTSTAATVDVTGTGYGLTFIDPDYIRANWDNADFQLLEQVPGGLRGFQDIITLKRR